MDNTSFNIRKIKLDRHEKLFILDIILTLLAVFSMGLFNPDYAMITTFLFIIFYMIVTRRKEFLYHYSIAFIISLIWVIIGNGNYNYGSDYMVLFGYSLFPIFTGSVGIFAIYLFYSYFAYRIKSKSFLKNIGIFSIIYWVFLIFVETVSYHILNVQNISASSYAGLPICNCLHAPIWMQIIYFLMGPLFFAVCHSLNLNNTSRTKTPLVNAQ